MTSLRIYSDSELADLHFKPGPGLKLLTHAGVARDGFGVFVFLFNRRDQAMAYIGAQKSMAHEYVFGTFDANKIKPAPGGGITAFFVDRSGEYDDSVRTPGLHVFDFRT